MSDETQVYDGTSIGSAVSDTNVEATTTESPPDDRGTDDGMNMPAAAHEPYPGEDAPLPRRHGGAPPSLEEALGVARRRARERAAKRGLPAELPEVVPFTDEAGDTPLVSIRIPRRTLWLAHAKAEMEARSVSDVVREALDGYISTPPGSQLEYKPPRF